MSAELEQARERFEQGDYKRAVARLWRAEATARSDLREAQGMLELAEAIGTRADGGVRRDCETLAGYAKAAIARLADDPTSAALVWIPGCRFLAGSGLDPEPERGSRWDLIFGEDHVTLRGGSMIELAWADVRALEVNGAGQVRQGMRWRGFGFGFQGAAEGALMAAALNSLTSTTSIDTVVRLETTSAEAFFHFDELVPDELRRRLAPAFVRLRQVHGDREATREVSQEHWVDKLYKLGDLWDRGLLPKDEFERLKARLLDEEGTAS